MMCMRLNSLLGKLEDFKFETEKHVALAAIKTKVSNNLQLLCMQTYDQIATICWSKEW